MSPSFAAGKKARGFCDRCGFNYRLHELHPQVIDMVATGLLVCPECLDEDQPQLQLGRWPVDDPQALRNARPAGQEGGRNENSLVFDFNDESEGWEVSEGTLTYDPDAKSVLWDSPNVVSETQVFFNDGLTVNTALYRYVRMRVRFVELPDPLVWRLRMSWLRYDKVAYDRPMVSPVPQNVYQMGSDHHDIIWDMDDKNSDGDFNQFWKGAVQRLRANFFTAPVGGSFKVEIFGVYFEPSIHQPENSVVQGITNPKFTNPVFNHTLNEVGLQTMITTQHGGVDAIPGWTCESTLAGSVNGVMGVHWVKVGTFDPVPDFNQYAYIQPDDTDPKSFSQVTGNVLAADTEYTVKVDVGRRNDAEAPTYVIRMKAGGDTLSSNSSPVPASGTFETSTVVYTTSSSPTQSGSNIELELEQSSIDNDVAGQVGFYDVRLTSQSASAYKWEFLTGDDGFTAVNGTVSWNESSKTITLTSDGNVDDDWGVRIRRLGVSGVLASDAMKIRMRVKINTNPAATWKGELQFRRHYSTWQVLSPEAADPGFSNNVGEWYLVEFLMEGSSGGWTHAIGDLEWPLWESGTNYGEGVPTDSVGVVEIDWISLEKFPKDPDPNVKYGITNYDFASPQMWTPASGSYQHDGNLTNAITGWTADAATVQGSDGNVGIASPGGLFTPVSSQAAQITTQDVAIGFSQVTSNVLAANTRYEIQVEVGLRSDQSLPVSYKIIMKADGVELATSDDVGQQDKVVPDPGEFLTSSLVHTTGSSDAQIGKSIEIRIENTGTDPDVNGPINFDNVRLFSGSA